MRKVDVRLTKAISKRITEDWQRMIPSLGIYEPRSLLRRVGPLLMGICLERDSGGDIYKPGFHVHSLGRKRTHSNLILGLWTQLRSERSGGPSYIKVGWHDELYQEAVERMVRQSLLPLSGDLRLKDVLGAYESYMRDVDRRRFDVHLYVDMITISLWTGNMKKAGSILKRAIKNLGDEERYYRYVAASRLEFEAKILHLIDHPEIIRQTVEEQIIALKVGNLPVSQLLP